MCYFAPKDQSTEANESDLDSDSIKSVDPQSSSTGGKGCGETFILKWSKIEQAFVYYITEK